MTDRTVTHATFCLERTYEASRERVYAAFATEEGKARWFSGPNDQWDIVDRDFDFREGGSEHLSGRWKNGTVSDFRARYHDIVPNERIVYAYEMRIDGRKISVSLATLEFKPADDGKTRLVLTEQGAFLDGYDDAGSREHGTAILLDRVGASLVREPT
jgi:uncharacterized protein YndB with AHSA1/START domain